jgi:hypothetical protein
VAESAWSSSWAPNLARAAQAGLPAMGAMKVYIRPQCSGRQCGKLEVRL